MSGGRRPDQDQLTSTIELTEAEASGGFVKQIRHLGGHTILLARPGPSHAQDTVLIPGQVGRHGLQLQSLWRIPAAAVS